MEHVPEGLGSTIRVGAGLCAGASEAARIFGDAPAWGRRCQFARDRAFSRIGLFAMNVRKPLDISLNVLLSLRSFRMIGAAVLVTAQTTRARESQRSVTMAKGQEKPKTNNKPKLSVKEKKAKKKEKAASK
jgi:hypothetical protein